MKTLFSRTKNRILNKTIGSRELQVYTDGSSKDEVGSWAYLIVQNGKLIAENSGRIRQGNSNVMEFQAAIEALSALPENSKARVYSDSSILVQAMKALEQPPAFRTEIEALLELSQKHSIQWQWIKGHNGNRYNERCDELCKLARGF